MGGRPHQVGRNRRPFSDNRRRSGVFLHLHRVRPHGPANAMPVTNPPIILHTQARPSAGLFCLEHPS